jgi:signal transduction histidine kinase
MKVAAPPQTEDRLLAGEWLDNGMAVLNAAGCLVEINPALAAWLGAAPATLRGQHLKGLLTRRAPAWAEPLAAWEESIEPYGELELRLDLGPGLRVYRLESAHNRDGWLVRFHSVLPSAQELAESAWDAHLRGKPALREMFMRLVRAEDQLAEYRSRWPGVIFSQRPDFTFHSVSPNIEALTGLSAQVWEQSTVRFWQVVHEADAEELCRQIRQCIRLPQGVTTTYRIRNVQTGRVAYVLEQRRAVLSGRGLVLGYEGFWLDVTRQTVAEKRLLSAAWKETLGVLTMGLSHDFSNIMAGIHSLSESFLAQLTEDHPFHEGLSLIQRNSRQAGELAHRIIALHRGKTGERSYQDLNELVRDAVDLVSKIAPRRISVRTQLASEALPLYVDPVELRQVVVNLSRNAVDAMPRSGELTLETSRQMAFERTAFAVGITPRLPCIRLAVRDTGSGIKAADLPHVFDPFFTTKSVNEGSGLGLYNARLFAEKHQGAIGVESGPERGTCLTLWLPETDFTEADESPAASESWRRSILLVGPEGTRLEKTAEFLRLHDYQAVVAQAGALAGDLLDAAEYQVAGVMVLTGGQDSGLREWLCALRQDRPHLRLILRVAGLNQDELDARFLRLFDLVIEPDMPETYIVERLRAVFASTAPRN